MQTDKHMHRWCIMQIIFDTLKKLKLNQFHVHYIQLIHSISNFFYILKGI